MPTSEEFFKCWVQTVKKRESQLLSIWRDSTEFTHAIMGAQNSVLSEIAANLGLRSYEADYYCLDSILYQPEDLTPGLPDNKYWFRDVRVAFEHENKFNSDLYQEVSHLLITQCDLRVLVSYPNDDHKKVLAYLHSIISGTRHADKISEDGSFLMIFGYESGFCWEGRVYTKDGWKEIKIIEPIS